MGYEKLADAPSVRISLPGISIAQSTDQLRPAHY